MYGILIIGGSGSGKPNALLNLINNQPDIDKTYLHAKEPSESKYQYLVKKREKVGLYHYDDPKAFIEYLDDMQNYKNIEEYNLGKKCKVLTVFDDMIADMINNKRLNPVVAELLIRGRKVNISVVFIMQSFFKVSKEVRLSVFSYKIRNKRECQQKDNSKSFIRHWFQRFYRNLKKYATNHILFWLMMQSSDNPLRFKRIFWNKYIINNKNWRLDWEWKTTIWY